MCTASLLKKVRRRLASRIWLRWIYGPGLLVRKVRKRPLPRNPDGRVLVHVGCGSQDDRRYINIDSRPGWHIHFVEAIENIHTIISDDSADLIYASHVLEHISHRIVPQTLQQLYRCLKPGGVLRLAVPDFEALANLYKENGNLTLILKPLMGGQGYPENYHHAAFDRAYLSNLLVETGFTNVRAWTPDSIKDHSFNDESRAIILLPSGEKYPISLNIEAVKPLPDKHS